MTSVERVVAIDVGTRHLALVDVQRLAPPDNVRPDDGALRLNDVAVVSIDAPTVRQCCDLLPSALEALPMLQGGGDDETSSSAAPYRIVIEQQPQSNATMRIVAHALQTYFITRAMLRKHACTVVFQSARSKLAALDDDGVPPPATYAARKRLAVKRFNRWLDEHDADDVSPDARRRIDSLQKRDDVADAFLHAVYALSTRRRASRRRNRV